MQVVFESAFVSMQFYSRQIADKGSLSRVDTVSSRVSAVLALSGVHFEGEAARKALFEQFLGLAPD